MEDVHHLRRVLCRVVGASVLHVPRNEGTRARGHQRAVRVGSVAVLEAAHREDVRGTREGGAPLDGGRAPRQGRGLSPQPVLLLIFFPRYYFAIFDEKFSFAVSPPISHLPRSPFPYHTTHHSPCLSLSSRSASAPIHTLTTMPDVALRLICALTCAPR